MDLDLLVFSRKRQRIASQHCDFIDIIDNYHRVPSVSAVLAPIAPATTATTMSQEQVPMRPNNFVIFPNQPQL